MKKLIYLILFLVFCSYEAYAMTGSGTALSPYLIYNCTDFDNIKLNGGAVYALNNDIDCNNFNFLYYDYFWGVLDGRNHTVNNLRRTNSGIFRYIGKYVSPSWRYGTVKNIGFKNITIICPYNTQYCGIITGAMYRGYIENVYIVDSYISFNSPSGNQHGLIAGLTTGGYIKNTYVDRINVDNVGIDATVGSFVETYVSTLINNTYARMRGNNSNFAGFSSSGSYNGNPSILTNVQNSYWDDDYSNAGYDYSNAIASSPIFLIDDSRQKFSENIWKFKYPCFPIFRWQDDAEFSCILNISLPINNSNHYKNQDVIVEFYKEYAGNCTLSNEELTYTVPAVEGANQYNFTFIKEGDYTLNCSGAFMYFNISYIPQIVIDTILPTNNTRGTSDPNIFFDIDIIRGTVPIMCSLTDDMSQDIGINITGITESGTYNISNNITLGLFRYKIRCQDSGSISGITQTYQYIKDYRPIATTFDNTSSTNLNNITDYYNVQSFILSKVQTSIRWINNVSLINQNLDANVILNHGLVSLNTTALDASLDSEANVTFNLASIDASCTDYELYYANQTFLFEKMSCRTVS